MSLISSLWDFLAYYFDFRDLSGVEMQSSSSAANCSPAVASTSAAAAVCSTVLDAVHKAGDAAKHAVHDIGEAVGIVDAAPAANGVSTSTPVSGGAPESTGSVRSDDGSSLPDVDGAHNTATLLISDARAGKQQGANGSARKKVFACVDKVYWSRRDHLT